MSGPVEAKAQAAPVGAVAGAAVGLALYILGTWVFHGPVPDNVQETVVPLVIGLCSAAGSFLAAYQAKHTRRPDLRRVP